eukprot:CAMPEP_0196662358 /NCGR_PEP_ID=MMETSP1086-20130531/48306_1 /TAXON_ID=77921 /ORGANISM="Cyanoptyche  gloeocystis , Strain SAG4.97" /LENGTH=75 /DNA_ID=CAMNT_0041997691 /DNA_START=129 /DNA_END=353 /DNA_ORIENTATION=+
MSWRPLMERWTEQQAGARVQELLHTAQRERDARLGTPRATRAQCAGRQTAGREAGAGTLKLKHKGTTAGTSAGTR